MIYRKIILILPLFLSLAVPAFAQESSPTPTTSPRQELRQERQETRQEFQNEKEDIHTTALQDRLTLRRRSSTTIANRIVSQLENYFSYLNKIRDRLQSRIDALKTTRNMTEAQAKLSQYHTDNYTQDLQNLKNLVAGIDTSDLPSTVLPSIKSAAKTVQSDLKDLRQILIDSLKLVIKAPSLN